MRNERFDSSLRYQQELLRFIDEEIRVSRFFLLRSGYPGNMYWEGKITALEAIKIRLERKVNDPA